MPSERAPKQILHYQPTKRHDLRRPRGRWLDVWGHNGPISSTLAYDDDDDNDDYSSDDGDDDSDDNDDNDDDDEDFGGSDEYWVVASFFNKLKPKCPFTKIWKQQ